MSASAMSRRPSIADSAAPRSTVRPSMSASAAPRLRVRPSMSPSAASRRPSIAVSAAPRLVLASPRPVSTRPMRPSRARARAPVAASVAPSPKATATLKSPASPCVTVLPLPALMVVLCTVTHSQAWSSAERATTCPALHSATTGTLVSSICSLPPVTLRASPDSSSAGGALMVQPKVKATPTIIPARSMLTPPS